MLVMLVLGLILMVAGLSLLAYLFLTGGLVRPEEVEQRKRAEEEIDSYPLQPPYESGH